MLGCFSRLVLAASKAIPRRLVSSMCCSFRLVRSSSPRLWVTRVLVKLVCLKNFHPYLTRRLDGKTIRAATTGNQNPFYVLPLFAGAADREGRADARVATATAHDL